MVFVSNEYLVCVYASRRKAADRNVRQNALRVFLVCDVGIFEILHELQFASVAVVNLPAFDYTSDYHAVMPLFVPVVQKNGVFVETRPVDNLGFNLITVSVYRSGSQNLFLSCSAHFLRFWFNNYFF